MVYRSISDTAYSIAQTPLFGLMIKAEPRWGRVDDVSGEPVDRYGVDLALVADKELVRNRIVAALNLIYLPEVARSRVTGIWLRQATIGVATALMRRLALIFSLGPKLDIFAATTDWISTASRATAFLLVQQYMPSCPSALGYCLPGMSKSRVDRRTVRCPSISGISSGIRQR
jgi:hypothetical protein